MNMTEVDENGSLLPGMLHQARHMSDGQRLPPVVQDRAVIVENGDSQAIRALLCAHGGRDSGKGDGIGPCNALKSVVNHARRTEISSNGGPDINIKATGEVYALAFSPDGELFVYVAEECLMVISSQTWQPLRPPLQATGKLRTVTFSPDSTTVAYGGHDQVVSLVHTGTWEPIHEPLEAFEVMLTAAFSPDGKMLVYGGQDKRVTIVNTKTWIQLRKPVRAGGWVRDVAFSPDGLLLACTGDDKQVSIISTETWEHIRSPLAATEWMHTVAISPDGTVLAYGGDDAQVNLVSTRTWERLVEPLHCAGANLRSTAFSPDGATLAYAGLDDKVRLVSTRTWDPVRAPLEAGGKVRAISFSHDGSMLAYTKLDGNVRIVRLRTWEQDPTMLEEDEWVVAASFSPNGSVLAYAGENKKVKLVSVGTWRPLAESPISDGTIHTIAFSPDGAMLAYAGTDEVLRLLETSFWAPLREPLDVEPLVSVLQFSPKSNMLAYGGDAKRVTVISTTTWAEVCTPFKLDGPVFTLSFSPDGDLLAFGGADEKVYLVRCSNWEPLVKPLSAAACVSFVTFTPDSSLLAFGGTDDDRITVVNTRTWTQLCEPLSAGRRVRVASFSPDGLLLAFAGEYLVSLVSTQTWEMVRAPLNAGGKLHTIAFSPDSGMLVYAGEDRNVRVLSCCARCCPYAFDVNEPLVSEICDLIRKCALGAHGVILGWLHKYGGLFAMASEMHGGLLPLEIAILFSKSDLVVKLLEEKPRLATSHVDRLFKEALDRRDRTTLVALLRVYSNMRKYPGGLLATPVDVETLHIRAIARVFPDILLQPFQDMELHQTARMVTEVLEHPITIATASEYQDWGAIFERGEHHLEGRALSVAKRVAWAGLGRREVLVALLHIGKAEIFNTKTMTLVVEVLWKQYFRIIFLGFFVTQLLYVALVGVFAAYVHEGRLSGKAEGGTSFGSVCGVLALIWASLLLCVDALKLWHTDKKGRWNGWNILDIGVHAMVITSYILNEVSAEEGIFRSWVGTTVLLLFFNNLRFLKGFASTASMVKMIFTVMHDIVPFMIILVFVLVGFAFFFWVSFPYEAEAPGYKTFTESLLSTFINGVAGEVDISMFGQTVSPALAEIMFVLLTLIVLVVMLNLLIALMGSSYEKVMCNFTAELLRERAAIIVNMMGLLKIFPGKLRRLEDQMNWFHVLLPGSKDDAGYGDEWSGQLHAVKNEITAHADRVMARVDARVDEVQSDIEGLKRGMNLIMQHLGIRPERRSSELEVYAPKDAQPQHRRWSTA